MPEPIATGTRAPDAPRPPGARVRYADPAAWLVCDLVGQVLRDWPGEHEPVGVLGVSEYATGDTLRRVAAEVVKQVVSPLRFVAASPGTLIGLSCLQFGLHGPSLLLTMPPVDGVPVARVLMRPVADRRGARGAARDARGRPVGHPPRHLRTPGGGVNTGVTAREVEDLLARTTWPGATGACAGVGELADRFTAAGFAPGSVVLVALPNGTRLIRVFFALVLAGLVPTLLAASTPASRLRATARRLGATALVRPGTETDQVTVTRLDAGPVRTHRPGQAILLTSGTSGMATGCLHDITALRRNAARHARSIGLGPADRMLVTLPMHYSYALVAQVLAGLVTGASLVVTGPPFTPAGYRDVVAAHDVTVSALTPLLVADLQADGGRAAPRPARARRRRPRARPGPHR